MAEVIDIASRRQDPHSCGEAVCQTCGHKWVQVAPVGELHLKCPKCESLNGVYRHGFDPPVGEPYLVCECGETLFWVQPKGVLCRRCGRTHER